MESEPYVKNDIFHSINTTEAINTIQNINHSLPLELIFPEREERHKNSRPPKEAYLFIPKPSDFLDYDEKNPKNSRRKIFDAKREDGECDYTRFELENLDQLITEIQNLNNDQNSTNPNSSLLNFKILKKSEMLRFLQSTSFDIKKTIGLIKDHLDWKLRIYPIKINEKINDILNSGFMYIHGRDNHFRPIVVIKAQKYFQLSKKYNLEDFLNAITYFIDYLVLYCLIPGQVECWDIIADLSNVSIMFLPADLIKMFGIFQCHYRARLCTVFILGMSRILNALWSVVKKLFDAQTNKKIRFVKDLNYEEIFEFINKEQVEEMYGGTAPDLNEEVGYFPPMSPSLNFFKSEEQKRDLLIDEEKYLELVKCNKLTTISPYFQVDINKPSPFANNSNDNYENKTIYSVAVSIYEDAQSMKQSGEDYSVYENCKDIKSNIGNNELKEKLIDEEKWKENFKEDLVTPQNDQEMEFDDSKKENDHVIRSKGIFHSKMKSLPNEKINKDVEFEEVVRPVCCPTKPKCIIY